MKISREITVFSFGVLMLLYMSLGRRAGSNQHRGSRGNCLTMSHDPHHQRSFSVCTGEVWRSTNPQAPCCDVTAQFQSHMARWYYQELRSDTNLDIPHRKKKGGERRCPCINSIVCQNHQNAMVHQWSRLFPLSASTISIEIFLPLPFPHEHSSNFCF